MAGKMTKHQMIKRVRGRMKILSNARHYPYTKWISRTEHLLCDSRGTYFLDTKQNTKRYNDLRFMNKTQIEKIMRKLK